MLESLNIKDIIPLEKKEHLAYYHYRKGSIDRYFFVNEGLTDTISVQIRFHDNREALLSLIHILTPWLSENVLGVKILEPGCKKIKVEPHLGDLEWAKGTYPTPYGEITVSHVKQADGSIETTVDAPEEIEVL